MVRTDLTPNQSQALALAAPAAKAALRRTYNAQNANKGTGAVAKGSRTRGVNFANMQRMPRGTIVRDMPDMSRGNWEQTPATSNVLAPRGFGYYDAFEHDPFSVATHMSIGPATPIVGTTVVSEGLVTKKPAPLTGGGVADGLEAGAKLLIVMPSPGSIQAVLYECSSNLVGDYIDVTQYNSPQLLSDPPDNAIPTRCSMRMRNWTQHVGTGGIVRVLRLTTGVALGENQTKNEELALFCEGIRTHTRTRTYSGEELIETHQKNCTVVDQSKATWFSDWNAIMTYDQLPWTSPLGWNQLSASGPFTRFLHDPAYTPIAILFEPFVAAVSGGVIGNKYEVNIRSQFLAHYAQGSMLANMAVSPPATPDVITKHRDHEESKGSILERVGSAISHGASWAWNHRDSIAPVLGAVGRVARRGLPQIPAKMPLMLL